MERTSSSNELRLRLNLQSDWPLAEMRLQWNQDAIMLRSQLNKQTAVNDKYKHNMILVAALCYHAMKSMGVLMQSGNASPP